MTLTRRLLTRLWSFATRSNDTGRKRPADVHYDSLIQAQGYLLALLSAILEREGVIAGDELARLLTEFATVTATDKPAEGYILAIWASYLQGEVERLRETPSLH